MITIFIISFFNLLFLSLRTDLVPFEAASVYFCTEFYHSYCFPPTFDNYLLVPIKLFTSLRRCSTLKIF